VAACGLADISTSTFSIYLISVFLLSAPITIYKNGPINGTKITKKTISIKQNQMEIDIVKYQLRIERNGDENDFQFLRKNI